MEDRIKLFQQAILEAHETEMTHIKEWHKNEIKKANAFLNWICFVVGILVGVIFYL
jgi:hypothetical protein